MAIAIPASAKVLSWLATIWRARPLLTTPMLFALGFVSLFITGGLTGPILAQPILDEYLHNTFFVVAHFHLIMAMAGVFGLFCRHLLLVPARSPHGRILSEPLGQLHFWLTLLGAYATFLPMHFTGLAGEPRHYAQLTGIPNPPAQALLASHSCHSAPHHLRAPSSSASPNYSSSSTSFAPCVTADPADVQSLARHHPGMAPTPCSTPSNDLPIPVVYRPSLQLLRRR